MKTFSQFLLEATDPKGPIKKYMSPEEIAKKHKLSLDTINSQLKMGIKIESEHTGSKQMARMIALQHLEEFPDYYSRLKKVESKKSSVKESKEEELRYCPACKKAESRGECKMGSKYWDKFAEAIKEERKSGDYSLHDWFSKSKSSDGKPGWVQLGGKYAGKPCAKQPGQTTKPKCGSSKMKAALSDEEEQKAFERKNRQDPNPDREGKAKMVATESNNPLMMDMPKPQSAYEKLATDLATDLKRQATFKDAKNARIKQQVSQSKMTEEKDACYSKVKSRYKVWPSAYASGALVKCRKVGAKNWGNKSESYDYSNWREEFKATEYEFFDVIKPDPIKSSSVSENYTRVQSRGTTYSIVLNWRGKYLGVQMFFPQFTRPSKEQVSFEVRKLYPGAMVLSFNPAVKDPTKPLLFTGEINGSK